MSYESLVERMNRYGKMLEDEKKVEHAMKRLEELPVTLEMLRESGVGRAMGKLRKSKKFGERAMAIVNKWKELAHAPSEQLASSREQVDGAEREAREQRAVKRRIEPDIELERQKRMR